MDCLSSGNEENLKRYNVHATSNLIYEPMSACGVREEVTLVFDSPIRHGNPPLGTKMGERREGREGKTPIFVTPPARRPLRKKRSGEPKMTMARHQTCSTVFLADNNT